MCIIQQPRRPGQIKQYNQVPSHLQHARGVAFRLQLVVPCVGLRQLGSRRLDLLLRGREGEQGEGQLEVRRGSD